jgi:hypothetical protein
MNIGNLDGTSLWIDRDTECTLNGGSPSPYFVPKIINITLEYDSLLSNSFSLLYS